MLAPDVHTVAVDLLRPPAGFHLDQALLTTYSLDLETLLALPLAVLAQAEQGLENLLSDPLLLVEALREAGSRLHVFVDHGGMAIPRAHRDLYALLEPSVHPAESPNKGAFHPKIWVARFIDKHDHVRLRVAVLSRNLTFDRSWDLALVSEATPAVKQRSVPSRPLRSFLKALPNITQELLPPEVLAALTVLASEVDRARFPSPEGFKGPITFHTLGLGKPGALWKPRSHGLALIAIAPFVSSRTLKSLANLSGLRAGQSILLARQDQLDALTADPRDNWGRVCVLSDAATEDSDDSASRPSGLHAKAVAIEHGHDVTWWVGSANLSDAAWRGHNVEVMASLTGKKGRRDGTSGQGIHRFLESGFDNLLEDYVRAEVPADPPAIATTKRTLAAARAEIVGADLNIHCSSTDDGWIWAIDGELDLPDGVTVHMWPVTRSEAEADALVLPYATVLPMASLTCFVAFRIHAQDTKLPDERLTRKLPAVGLPDGRVNEVLRTLISSPERLLRFLRALLGGLEGILDFDGGVGDGSAGGWGDGLGGETLLEDLVRAASRDPKRLAPVSRILDDLQQTEEGRAIIPPGLLETWKSVQAALPEDTP